MMKKLNLKTLRFLSARNYPTQLLIFLLAGYATIIMLIPIEGIVEIFWDVTQLKEPPDPANLEQLPLNIIVTSVLETFVYQYLLFRIFRKWIHIKNKYFWAILISSLIFGFMHYYDVMYIIFAFLQGLTLGYCYYFYKRNLVKAFWSTALVHAAHNSIAVLLAVIFPDI
ncbi:MAG: CPBP family intramembrane metalloprotease [Chitinophagales bacterium]|nr:CPBP family intramembrane metalloprotease [Chitinophagales bacterium]